MVQTKRNQEKVVVTKICFYGKTKWKMKVGITKIQPGGSDKKELEKDVLLKHNLMVHTKRKLEKRG